MKFILIIIFTSLVILLLVFLLNVATFNGVKTPPNKQLSSEKNESLVSWRNGFNVTYLSMSGANIFLAVALLGAATASTGGIALGVFCALVATALLVVVISDALEQRQEMKKVPAEFRAEILKCVRLLKKAETVQEILKQEESLRGYIRKCKEIGGRDSRELSKCAGRYLPEFRYQVLHGVTVEEVRKVVSPDKRESFLPHVKKFCAKENIDMQPTKIKNRPQFSYDRSKRREA
ncbi:MAG: hypothetical protein EBT45_08810, partial [Alphaproteobacteria bacterium]|nr:hypothetical protein [Alphaproteobacteria bacterium]